MKKLLLFAACLAAATTAFGQSKGQVMLGGSVQIHALSDGKMYGGEPALKTTGFSISPSLHCFVSDHLALGIGIGYGYTMNKDVDSEYNISRNKVHSLAFTPSLVYYLKLAEKFYYTLQGFIWVDFSHAVDSEINTLGYGIGLSPLNFEFRPVEHWGIGFFCGSLTFQHNQTKFDKNDDSKYTGNAFNFALNSSCGIALRYFF